MSQIHWTNPVSADFSTTADWTGGVAPGSGDDAILDAPGGTPYTVSATTSPVVASIQTAASATLAITSGSFTASGGSGAGANAGIIQISDGGSFIAAGSIDNTGSIALDSAGDATELLVGAGGLTLSGGGSVELSDNAANAIDATASGATLTIADDEIDGSGTIGSANLAIVNDAGSVIRGDNATPLVITGAGVTNQGKIMAGVGNSDLAHGNVLLANVVIDNTGGKIKALPPGAGGAGSIISLQSVTIIGGKLKNGSGSRFQTVDSGSVLDGSTSLITYRAYLQINDGTALTLKGQFDYEGLIEVGAPGGGGASLFVNNVTLTSVGGVIGLEGPNDVITGVSGSSVFDNGALITGWGDVGVGNLTLTNLPSGTINPGNVGQTITIDTGGNTVVNQGLIDAGPGDIDVLSPVDNSGLIRIFPGGKAKFTKNVAGSGSAEIDSGTLKFDGAFSQDVTFSGPGTLILGQSQGFAATITGFSTGGPSTQLDLRDIGFVSANEATFVGNSSGGVITVTDGTHTANINLVGDYTGSTFTAASDGVGGVIVTDPPAGPVSRPMAAGFVQAMAGVGARSAFGLSALASRPLTTPPILAVGHAAMT